MTKSKPQKLGDFVGSNEPTDSIQKIYSESILTPEEEIPKPEVVFGVNDPNHGDIYVGTKGNISMFKGAKKSRKTFAISSIAAAVAGQIESIQFKSFLPGKGRILYVDTEQGRYDCKKVLNRIWSISKLDMEPFKKHVIFLTLRPYSPKTRKEVIGYAIKKLKDKLDMVIIDGIRDLITDINDPTEATGITTDLMAWSSDNNIHILNILHENKSNQNARGHLGTELDNKAESICRVIKVDNQPDFSAIEAESMRGLSFDPYVFMINSEGHPIIADDVEIEDIKKEVQKKTDKKSSSKTFDYADIEQEEHVEIIRTCFMNEHGMFDHVDPLSAREFYKRLKAEFKRRSHTIGDHKTRQFTDKYLDDRLLTDLNENEDTNVKRLVPGFDDELPF